MKKSITMFLVFTMAFVFAACGAKEAPAAVLWNPFTDRKDSLR